MKSYTYTNIEINKSILFIIKTNGLCSYHYTSQNINIIFFHELLNIKLNVLLNNLL